MKELLIPITEHFNEDENPFQAQSQKEIEKIERKELSVENKIPKKLTGKSKVIVELNNLIDKIAPFNFPVLIVGETGTGKEVVANLIHQKSPYYKEPFIVLNCGAIPDSLLTSELFGYTKGAFTGANIEKRGILGNCGRGTLFLDEIEAASFSLQTALLRVIENREYIPLGCYKKEKFEGRILAASNVNLLELCKKGNFRYDLYYRLCAYRLSLPPLSQRKEDIPLLVREYSQKIEKFFPFQLKFSEEAMNKLIEYEWPGNVRQLHHFIMQCAIESEEGYIDEILVSKMLSLYHSQEKKEIFSFNFKLQDLEKETLLNVLKLCDYNKSKTAKMLGISRTTLYSLMKKFSIIIPNISSKKISLG